MKIAFLTLLFIPFLAFGQPTQKDKKSIEKYALSMCECLNDLMSELHPKTVEVVLLMGEKGTEEAMKDVDAMLADMSPKEMEDFLASFTQMDSPEFLERIEGCNGSESLGGDLKKEIDKAKGDAHTYLLVYLGEEETCKVMKAFYDLMNAGSQ